MGCRHPLLLIPDAFVVGALTFFGNHVIEIMSATYFVVGILVGLKQLFKKE